MRDKMKGVRVTASVFDEYQGEDLPKTVPVTVEISGHKRVIGDALIRKSEGGVLAEIRLNTDDPDEAIAFLSGGLTSIRGFSIDEADVTIHEDDSQTLFEIDSHHPTPPGNFGFPSPSRLHGDITNG